MMPISLPYGYGTRAWLLALLYHNQETGLSKEQLHRSMPHGYGSALSRTLITLASRGLVATVRDTAAYQLTPAGIAITTSESLDLLASRLSGSTSSPG